VNDEQMFELLKIEVAFDILVPDVEQHLADGQRDLEQSRMNEDAILADFFIAYHQYDGFVAYLRNITYVYPSISTFVPSIGKSVQGRDIFAVTIGSKSPRKKIFVSGGQHAREWVAPSTTMFILTQLITLYSSNSAVRTLLDNNQFIFVPLVNPDGYVFTWTGTNNRLWRKNRRLNTGGTYGVDLNRNWDIQWGGVGSSHTPSSDTYCGTAPFSEPESSAVRDYLNSFNSPVGAVGGAIDYHSYSQLILRPYGYTNALPPNDAIAKLVGDTIRARILAVNNVAYTSQASWQLYYTTGSAQDWYYSKGVPLAYTIELRDTGTYGFQLPAAQIKPTGTENWAGFLYFAQYVLN